MANYSINPNGALDTAAELEGVTRKLEQSLDTLAQAVNRFTVANAGHAPEAYATAQSTWNQGHLEMDQALQVGQARLQEIAQHYVLSDNRAAAVFDGSV